MNRKEKRKIRIQNKVNEMIEAYRTTGNQTDPLGQYTGVTSEVKEAIQKGVANGKIYTNPQNVVSSLDKPVQDADDL